MTGSKLIALLLLVWALFWPIAWQVPHEILFEVLNAVGVVLGLVALIAAAPGIIRTFYRGRPMPGEYYLLLGIVSAWLAILTRSITLGMWRWQGEPPGGLDGLAMAFAAYVTVTAAVLLLAGVFLRRREFRRQS
jgi:hypothetical protein